VIFIAFSCLTLLWMPLPSSCFLAPSSSQLPSPSPAPVPHTDVNTGIYHGPCNLHCNQPSLERSTPPRLRDRLESTLGELELFSTCLSTGITLIKPLYLYLYPYPYSYSYRIQGLPKKRGAEHSPVGRFGDSTRIPE
jgi:hypothetical protein